ncbi:periplasmic heavy metal sensor [Coraliomargarita sp. SDUM461004]|uniref:Periplasmic heavy metal sensor n=1 Tax=Thalassobacterium sedimentorum TaxID=3041258 RepID=A0ABU1AKI4_9BACT|nr:periplasmic heavy metal sensor [Coraliomargarita sp. SDUM461004]MDQ8195298.1 periplasmic heavy metal sensor [Coraliomargarita sp. SDUM461004]
MKNFNKTPLLAAAFLALASSTAMLQAQPDSHTAHADMPQGDLSGIQQQLTNMQVQLGSIEAALNMNHSGTPVKDASMPMKGMGMKGMMMGDGQSSGMADMDMGDTPSSDMNMGSNGMMGGMKPKGKMKMDKDKMPMGMMNGGMSMDGGMSMGDMGMKKGMAMMGSMQDMGGTMSMDSALPGFPGISHIYHIGATGYFLNHGDHLNLSPEQQKKLGELKQASELKQATYQREITAAEQELWELTAVGDPDFLKIEAKVKAIAKKQTEKRLDFIRSVGEAAKVLTDAQRQILAGDSPAAPADPVDHSAH